MRDYRDKDRSGTVLCVALSVVVILVALSAVPPFDINGLHVRRANLLSSFVTVEDNVSCTTTSNEWVEGDKLISQYTEKTVRDIPEPMKLAEEMIPGVRMSVADTLDEALDVAVDEGIEDYSESGFMMDRFLKSLSEESATRNVRIAFLGDSFIEGDILTSSLRNDLQTEFGGEGVGFVPFADPIAKYRGTVRQEYSGWTCYNLLRRKNVPDRYKNDFYISGYVCVPEAGATARFASGSCKGRRLSSTHARIFFKNRDEGRMNVVVNDSDTLYYDLALSDEVQCIDICRDRIDALSVSLPLCRDFVGYGVVFEGDRGVTVDNYGLRSHSGVNLLSTSGSVNSQMAQLMNYDLIVMEYGLNAMQKSVTQYKNYTDKFCRAVKYIQSAFPESSIMIMSVGDVGMKVDNQVITAPAVPAMVGCQRMVAKDCDVSFLNMFHQMGGVGSMKRYVDNGWANKDYLHINFKGGDQLAKCMLKSIRDRQARI